MKRVYLLCMATMLFVACTQDRTVDVELSGDKIYASIEKTDAQGRVQLNEQKQTVWTSGDEIYTFHKTEGLQQWKFDGKTGDRSGSFSLVGSAGNDYNEFNIEGYKAFYPIQACYGLVYDGASELGLFATINSSYDYEQYSYGLHANSMLGTSTDGENFSFQNLHGYLQLSLTGDKRVKTISIENINGQYMSGVHYFFLNYPDVWGWYEDTSSRQTINCGEEGVQLSATPTDFFFVLPPMNVEGLIVTVTFTDETYYRKSTSKTIPIARNTIQPMAVIDTSEGQDSQRVYIYHTGKTMVTPIIGSEMMVVGTIAWGDGTVSLLDEFTSYDYTDDQASHTITVTTIDADSIILNDCTGVTKIDLSNF